MMWWIVFIMAVGQHKGQEVSRYPLPGYSVDSCRQEAVWQMQKNARVEVHCVQVVN